MHKLIDHPTNLGKDEQQTPLGNTLDKSKVHCFSFKAGSTSDKS